MHYGSDEGVEMTVACLNIISIVMLHGMLCLNYHGEFFKKNFTGCRDFLSLMPSNIGLSQT